jgi:ribose-phosphate pyrophosphokinase
MHIIGDVSGRDCIIFDDIIDSGGTLCNAADALLSAGAHSVSAMISHGVLSGQACGRINSSNLHEVVVTDSIDVRDKVAKCKKIRQLTVAPLFAEAIRRIDNCESVSKLFD